MLVWLFGWLVEGFLCKKWVFVQHMNIQILRDFQSLLQHREIKTDTMFYCFAKIVFML